MTAPKKKFIFLFLILIPSLFVNYFTLTYIDHDNNLSNFSTIIITSFNILNLFFGYILYKYSFKILLFFSFYCFLIFVTFDFISEKLLNKSSIIKEDKTLGWILKANKKVKFDQQTFKGEKYKVNFRSSKVEGFREFGSLNSINKKILVIGDSYTVGPYSSNEKMYYSILKKYLSNNNLNYEWFVMGAGGYGTVQQILLLNQNFNNIKPDIVLHQFCVNDFFDNSLEISRLSTSHDQYYRRPYLINNEIIKVDTLFADIYRFLFKYSFIFKKFDQIYTYKQLRNHGRFKSLISKELINNSVANTRKLIFRIRDTIGKNTLYLSTNCADEKNNDLSNYWREIIQEVSGYPLSKPSKIILEMKKNGEDVMHEDGGHLNDYGNNIYGKAISEEFLKILLNAGN